MNLKRLKLKGVKWMALCYQGVPMVEFESHIYGVRYPVLKLVQLFRNWAWTLNLDVIIIRC